MLTRLIAFMLAVLGLRRRKVIIESRAWGFGTIWLVLPLPGCCLAVQSTQYRPGRVYTRAALAF